MRTPATIALLGLLVLATIPFASAGSLEGGTLRAHCPDPTIDWVICYVLENPLVDRAIYEALWALGLVTDVADEVCDHLTSLCPTLALAKSVTAGSQHA